MAYTYLILGGGIIGSAIARELALRRYGKVTILEKEDHLGEHASGRNSGVFHSGINQKPGSLKAKMCIDGNQQARELCQERGVAMEQCGTHVIARSEEEEYRIAHLKELGEAAGVQGLQIISGKELQEREPAIIARKALFSPNGAIVDSLGFLQEVAREAQEHGVQYELSSRVRAIHQQQVMTNKKTYTANHIINCAGLYADTIAHLMGMGGEYRIIPFRGEYQAIDNLNINSMVYQPPDLRYPFLGVHLTKSVLDGKTLAGPTATLSLGKESYGRGWNLSETVDMIRTPNFWNLLGSKEFLQLAWHNARMSISQNAFLEEIKALCPSVRKEDITAYRSGIRAQVVRRDGTMLDDILVEFHEKSTHVLNAVSPGMTCSLAFAKYVADRIPH